MKRNQKKRIPAPDRSAPLMNAAVTGPVLQDRQAVNATPAEAINATNRDPQDTMGY